MSAKLKQNINLERMSFTRYSRKAGAGLQITVHTDRDNNLLVGSGVKNDDFIAYIQVSRDEAYDLALELLSFAAGREEAVE